MTTRIQFDLASLLGTARSVSLTFLAALTVSLFLITTPAWAAKLYVQNWGVDSGGCGAVATPCRSIGKAVSLAVSGDTVLVGPGLYSNDLNNNGTFDEPGEEPSAGISIGATGVTLQSTHGAAATRIEYTGPWGTGIPTFRIVSGGGGAVVFGKKNHGFTLYVAPTTATPFSATVIAAGNVSGNVVLVYDTNGDHTLAILADRVIRDNRVGGLTTTSLATGIDSVNATIVERNVVSGASTGFIGSDGAFRHNVAIEDAVGFVVNGTITEFTNNIAVANLSYGIEFSGLGTTVAKFKNNTIDNNDPVTNCGLLNQTGSALVATKNFWGAATGPGANPADGVCNSGAGSSTTSTPFLTHPVAGGPGAVQ